MVRTRRTGGDLRVGRLAVAPDLRGRTLRGAEAAGEGRRRIVLFTGAAGHRDLTLHQGQGCLRSPTRWPAGW